MSKQFLQRILFVEVGIDMGQQLEKAGVDAKGQRFGNGPAPVEQQFADLHNRLLGPYGIAKRMVNVVVQILKAGVDAVQAAQKLCGRLRLSTAPAPRIGPSAESRPR